MRNTEIGIIGGGQLGMLLLQAAIPFPAHVSIYDPSPTCPAAYFTKRYYQGNFESYDDILSFADSCDLVLFETEKANIDALFELQRKGKKVYSDPASLQWIQDKGVQRQRLQDAGFPVPDFSLVASDEIENYQGPFPIVQKLRKGGYDGKGVFMHKDSSSLKDAPKIDSVFEKKVDIWKEISLLVARNEAGEVAVYAPIEMVFDERAHLVDYLISPARIEDHQIKKLNELAIQMAQDLNFIGVYAIETFIDQDGEIWINEIAPRPHNSGHHTVFAHVTSQYEQQIRIGMGLPLGSVEMVSPCVMLNLLGDTEKSGPTRYKGLQEAYRIPGVQYVFYGKSEVTPFRKMGHALILDRHIDSALEKLDHIRSTLTITTHD